MKKDFSARFVVLSLVILLPALLVNTAVKAGSEGAITTADEFIERLEKEYREISNFSARLKLSGLEPPLTVKVLAVTEPRTLRVEYTSPEEMKGQFFLLKEDLLYQYMPGRDLIIEKELTKSNIPVKAANLTPNYLLELVRSDDLEVNLIGTPGVLFFPGFDQTVLDLGTTVSGLGDVGKSVEEDDFGSGNKDSSGFLFSPEAGEYVLEVIPKVEGYQFARQVIKFDPDDFLPRELVTHFADETKEPVYTLVKEVEINLDIDLEELTKLPENAERISG